MRRRGVVRHGETFAGSFECHHGKLISTKARDDVGTTKCFFQSVGSPNNGKVSLAMPPRIIDFFQIVDVGKEKQQPLRLSVSHSDLLPGQSQKRAGQ